MAPENRSERRRRQVAGLTAASLLLSLIGGILVLLFSTNVEPSKVATKKIQPSTTTVTVTPSATSDALGTDLSIFGMGDTASLGADTGSSSGAPAGSSSGLVPGAAAAPAGVNALPGQLPTGQLPAGSELPVDAVDWEALVAPLADAQRTAQAYGLTGSILGTSVGGASALLTSTAVIVGDLILYAAYTNSGPGLLNGLQTSLVATPVAAAAASSVPPVDFTGLTTAFAAAAASPPVGMPALPPLPAPPALPQLPALPPPPGLPSPEQLAAGITALPALGGLAGFGLPELPPPPQLPRPEDVVGGLTGAIVGATIAGAVLGAIFPPPSITRMMGLPF